MSIVTSTASTIRMIMGTDRPALWHAAAAPLVINDTPEVCPVCGLSDAIASVYRDMGSERYCNRCRTVRWPNPSHPRGAVKLAWLREQIDVKSMAVGELLAAVASEARDHLEGSAKQKAAWDEIKRRVEVAQAGLKRALDFRTATPEGLAIKDDVRRALVESGCPPGTWGEVGS